MTDHFEDFENIATEFVKTVDWFILEGADVEQIYMKDEWSSPEGPLAQAFISDIDFYIGHPTCGGVRTNPSDFISHGYDKAFETDCPSGHVVEVAGLAVLGSPLDLEVLYELVQPLNNDPSVDHHSVDIDVSFDESNNVWVTRRLSSTDIESANFDSIMRAFVALTQRVSEAVMS